MERKERYTKNLSNGMKDTQKHVQKNERYRKKEKTHKKKAQTKEKHLHVRALRQEERKEIQIQKRQKQMKNTYVDSYLNLHSNLQNTNVTVETRKRASCILSNISKSGSVSIFVYEANSFKKI